MLSTNHKRLLLVLFLTINLILIGCLFALSAAPATESSFEKTQIENLEINAPHCDAAYDAVTTDMDAVSFEELYELVVG